MCDALAKERNKAEMSPAILLQQYRCVVFLKRIVLQTRNLFLVRATT
jgi:hypothetical protein